MKHFKDFIKDIEASNGEEETTEEEVETGEGESEATEEDEIKEFGPPEAPQSDQERARDAWYKGDDHYADHKKANPRMHKKVPVKKKGMTIPKGHMPKDSQEKNRAKFYAEK